MSRVIAAMSELYRVEVQDALGEGLSLDDASSRAISALYASGYSYPFTNYWEGEGDEADSLRAAIWSIDYDFDFIQQAKVTVNIATLPNYMFSPTPVFKTTDGLPDLMELPVSMR